MRDELFGSWSRLFRTLRYEPLDRVTAWPVAPTRRSTQPWFKLKNSGC